MQTFLPYADFDASAASLDTQRLGKQRVENLQIMQALFGVKLVTKQPVHTGIFVTSFIDRSTGKVIPESDLVSGQSYKTVEEEVIKHVDLPREKWEVVDRENAGWSNHSATRMWRGHEWSLLTYQAAIIDAWTFRYEYADTCWPKTLYLYFWCNVGADTSAPDWLGDPAVHISHQSNLIRKDPDFYSPQFPGVPDDIPYVWPVPRKDLP